jgi:predicted dehydrogenase
LTQLAPMNCWNLMGRLRIAFIGVEHWHFPTYLQVMMRMPAVEVVGVSDAIEEVARREGESLGCRWAVDFRDLCDRVSPDFVFALGRHNAMAAEADFLIDRGIPFAIEKPCGLNFAEVQTLAKKATGKGAFAAVPLALRYSPMMSAIREAGAGDKFTHLSFRFLAGRAERYRQVGAAWVLDPVQSGGGCLLTIGVLLIDLFRELVGDQTIAVRGAIVSNQAEGLGVEDYALLSLQAGGSIGVVETGYLHPDPAKADLRYSIRTNRRYFIASDSNTLEIIDLLPDESRTELPPSRTLTVSGERNLPARAIFCEDTINRVRRGQLPTSDLSDMCDIMRLVHEAYVLGGPLTPI